MPTNTLTTPQYGANPVGGASNAYSGGMWGGGYQQPATPTFGSGYNSNAYSQALQQWLAQQQEAQRRAEADRQRMLDEIHHLQQQGQNTPPPNIQNPYTDQWFQNAANQQGNERNRQLQATESQMVQKYANLGRAPDPRVFALLQNQNAQAGNADLANLRVGAAGNSFNASLAQNNAQQQYYQNQFGNQSQTLQMLYNVLNNTQYGPDPNQLALILQLGQGAALAPSNTGGSYGGGMWGGSGSSTGWSAGTNF